jgi:hypothetical protein
VHTFSGVTLKKAGSQTVTATDIAHATITGSQSVQVNPGAATHLRVTAPASKVAGKAFSITVSALDAFGNVATGYLGTVHFTSSDGQATLPANYAFVAGDHGAHTFTITLRTAGSQTVTATDTLTGSITGGAAVTVIAGAATHLAVSAPASATSGAAFTITVTALDAFGNVATGYTDTVHFTSSDPSATLPANYKFVAGDHGVHTFSNRVTLRTVGNRTVTATDATHATITGSASVNVTAAANDLAAPASVQPGGTGPTQSDLDTFFAAEPGRDDGVYVGGER